MKLSSVATLVLSAAAVMASVAPDSYIVSFPADTPQSKVDAAAQDLINKGATITHRYTLIKGFSVKSPPEVMADFKISAQSDDKYKATVEADQIVHTQDM